MHRWKRFHRVSYPRPTSFQRVYQLQDNELSRLSLTELWLIRYQVIVSVRSAAKGDGIISALPREFKADVSYEVVEDIAKENAFDEV